MNFPNAPFQSVITEIGGKLSSVWSQWISQLEYIVKTLTMAGKTSERPTERLWIGQRYYDSTLNQLVFWNGSEWLSAAVGYYASFYDTTNQTAANTTTAYPITCNTPNGADGIDLVDDSKITFAHPGRYNIQFSFQFVNIETNASNPAEVNIWFRLNGQDVAYSNSVFSIPLRHGSHNGHLIAALNFIVKTTSNNEYAQVMWQTENTTISIETLAAGTTPTTPITPGVIITAQQI